MVQGTVRNRREGGGESARARDTERQRQRWTERGTEKDIQRDTEIYEELESAICLELLFLI